ncbi:ATP-binding protein [Faecalibaculum rodentium]|nr:ATP-binding protein [Faecalibaculum rodentium]
MTAYEIYKYQAYRKGLKEDQRPVKDGWVLRNGELMNKYLRTVKASRINTFEHLSDSEILQLQKVEKDGCPTLAGLLVFSKYPQSAFPGLGITAVAVPGTVYGVTEADGTRFTDNVRIEGSLQEMLVSAMDFVRKNIRHRTVIDEMGQRADRWEYPLRAVREALLNALIHRDYSRHTDGTPIQLIIYEDRMEIINSGGVYGGFPVARLGKESPESRNSTLIRILEFLQISENRYSGIPTMKREMEKAGLPQPEFLDDGKQFKTILRNTVSSSAASLPARTENKADERIAVYCRTPRTRKEIADHLGMNYSYVSNGLIKPMILSGTLVEAGKKGREKLLQTRTDWSQREFEPVTEG